MNKQNTGIIIKSKQDIITRPEELWLIQFFGE